MKQLAIFHDSNRSLHRFPLVNTNSWLGEQLSLASRQLDELEVLAVSFMIDAADFFAPYERIADAACWTAFGDADHVKQVGQNDSTRHWRSLQVLALTSETLCRGNADEINELLRTVAVIAWALMPRIKALEIWYSEYGSSCSFYVNVGRDPPMIAWRTTRDALESVPSPEIVDVWNLVARKWQADRDVVVTTMKMPQIQPGERGYLRQRDRLGLAEYVLNPISLHQLHWEGIHVYHG